MPVDSEGAASIGVTAHGVTRHDRERRRHRPPPDPHGTIRAKYAVVVGLVSTALFGALVATMLIGTAVPPGLSAPGPLVRFGIPAVRTLQDISALGTVGLSLLPKLLDQPAAKIEPILSVARRSAVITALTWMLCALLALVLQTAELAPGRPVTTSMLLTYITGVPEGIGLLLTVIGALLCVLVGLLAVRFGESVAAELRAITALATLLPLPATGHATDWPLHDFGMLSMELHVLSAAMWAGGLAAVAVFVAPRRRLLADVLPRFSRLATLAVCTVGVTGVFNGITELLTTPGVGLPGLVTTTYGRIVIVKMVCLAVLAVLGGKMRFGLLPRITRHERTALIGWAAAEVSVMGLAYGLGVVLSRAPVL